MLNISNFVEAIKEYPWMNAFFVIGFLFLIISELTTLFNLRFHTIIRMMLHIIIIRTASTNKKIDANSNKIIKNLPKTRSILSIEDFRDEENLKLSENLLDLKIARKIYREPNLFSTINDANSFFALLFLTLLLFNTKFIFIPLIIFSLYVVLFIAFETFLFNFTSNSHDKFLKLACVEGVTINEKSDFTRTHQNLIRFVLADAILSLSAYVYGLFLVPGVARFFMFNFL